MSPLAHPPWLLHNRMTVPTRLGPLSMDTTKKVRQQGQRREKVDFSKATKASTAVDPDLEKKQDFSDRLVRELTALITEVDRSSEGDLSQAPNLFKLCVHPKSFSQTVENFFHLRWGGSTFCDCAHVSDCAVTVMLLC